MDLWLSSTLSSAFLQTSLQDQTDNREDHQVNKKEQ